MGAGNKLIEGISNDYLSSVFSYKHFLPKLIWSIVGLLMLVLGVYCAVELVRDYLSYPSYTEISSQFSDEYYLPAISICNINLINRTKMENTSAGVKNSPDMTVYYLYQALMDQYEVRSDSDTEERKDIPYEMINKMNIRRNYRWDILSTLDRGTFTFAKEKVPKTSQAEYVNVDFTEMGNCLEINDNQLFIQRVNGPIGGLSMILDARTEDYVDKTEAEGFFVVLRMPNETVISKEYAFAISPGKETFVQLDTTQVTRLKAPYGDCQDTEDVFKIRAEGKEEITDYLTTKECFTSQVLWKFMNEPKCKCYPWYVYARHFKKSGEERDTALESQLYTYFTTEIPEENRINFDNSTCYYEDEYSYSGGELVSLDSLLTAELCAVQCKLNEDCVVFMWVKSFIVENRGVAQCVMFDSSAVLSEDLEYRVTRGETNCTLELGECDITTEAWCENMVIDTMMSEENAQQPMNCYEPCSYNKTTYTLSSSNFPSLRLWNSELAASFPHYTTFAQAQRNLVKLIFYKQVMKTTEEVQTAAYNWRSFTGELGGTLDLFVGISMITIYKIVEWLLYLCLARRGNEPSEQDISSMKRNSLQVVSE
ncbi:amiloride-sensitive sodium channel subunit alpha-like [Bolinopsis microptera]|uniref:amiloride-sensitive sodium channel subunit alpha-like n=1 Tax=Bolinopsis microptera TaxID=2820187 RepID=UPI00307AB9E7